MNIPVEIQSDKKGYFDRECPNKDCQYTFKVLLNDWYKKIDGNQAHCPLCGCTDDSDKWWTQEQLSSLQEIASNYIEKMVNSDLDKVFGELAHSTRNNKYIKITYKPSRHITFINNPIGQREEWETEITCEKCGTRYSVIGSAFFCPCCGHNSAISAFNDSINTIHKMLDSLPVMRKTMIEENSRDFAETMYRGLVEDSLKNIVSVFQKFAHSIYGELSTKEAKVNDFQIVDKGNNLIFEVSGKNYCDWLSETEITKMKLMFQRRHLIEHNGGMIDQKYIDKSGDTSYNIGQRIVIKAEDVYSLLDIITKLGKGLQSLQKEKNDVS